MRASTAGLLLLLAGLPNNASAFELSGPVWVDGEATFFINIPGTAPSGDSWNNAFNRALAAWTSETSFSFSAVDEFRDPCADQNSSSSGDRINGVGFAATQCGSAFGTNVLAITLESFVCGDSDCSGPKEYVETDIIFNEEENWDIYPGPKRSGVEDFERVALHELGHALGLDHEFTAQAIMAPFIGDLTTLQLDDINGANTLYGTELAVPSVYGITIQVPTTQSFSQATGSRLFEGELAGLDAQVDNKFIDIYQVSFANDSIVELLADSAEFDTSLIFTRVDTTQQLVPGQLYFDENSGNGTNARILQTVPAGTYWAGVTSMSEGESGSYSLTVNASASGTSTPVDSFTSIYGIAVEINSNPFIFGALNSGDGLFDGKFVDLYQFELDTPIELKFDLQSTEFDTMLILAEVLPGQQLGSLQIENDDGGTGTNSRIQAELDPGTYWIAVTSFGNEESGDYEIAITVVID